MTNNSRRVLKPHQNIALRFAYSRPNECAGFFMAPGTGKTIPAIRWARGRGPTLILCRRDDYLTWQLELEAEGIDREQILPIQHWKQALHFEFPHYEHDENDNPIPLFELPQWIMVTYDMTRNQNVRDFIGAYDFRSCIADELHNIKRWSAKRTKHVIRCTRSIPRRLGLTGTALTNSIQDVFTQAWFIDDGASFGTSEWHFLQKHFVKDPTAIGALSGFYPKKGEQAIIHKALKKIAYSVHEDEVMKYLPPQRTIIKSCPMTNAQAKAYEQMVELWEAEIEGPDGTRFMEVNQVTTQISKLRQISSGFLYDEEHEAHWMDSGKITLLMDLIDDPDMLGQKCKVVIWCAHTAEIDAIILNLVVLPTRQDQFVRFDGTLPPAKKQAARLRFAQDPNCRFFVGQADAGVGMNELIGAADAVYFSNSYRVISKQQSLRRIRREGSQCHDRITYWELITEGSIDLKIYRSLSRHMSVADDIVYGLKRGQSIRKLLSSD